MIGRIEPLEVTIKKTMADSRERPALLALSNSCTWFSEVPQPKGEMPGKPLLKFIHCNRDFRTGVCFGPEAVNLLNFLSHRGFSWWLEYAGPWWFGAGLFNTLMKLSFTICAFILASCMVTKQVEQQRTFKVRRIDELPNGQRRVLVVDVQSKRFYTTMCTCDTVTVGLVFTANLLIPIK